MKKLIEDVVVSFKLLVFSTVVLGGLYPLVVYGLGRAIFPKQAMGSLIVDDHKAVGSELLAQKWTRPGFFRSRPSAGDFQTVPSGASNQGPTSRTFSEAVKARMAEWNLSTPDGMAELLTASGSGLDPELSPQVLKRQIPRILRERNLSTEDGLRFEQLIDQWTKEPTFGILGTSRVNVLQLNLALRASEDMR